jgi:hypothetical protein
MKVFYFSLAILGLLCFILIWIVEPIQGDYWYNMHYINASFWRVFWGYTGRFSGSVNIRIGQFFTILYTSSRIIYVVFSAFLLTLLAFLVAKLGQKESVSRGSSEVPFFLLFFSILIIATPEVALCFFYIPLNGNYVVPLIMNMSLFYLLSFSRLGFLSFLVFPLSFFCGMGNEHTFLGYLFGFVILSSQENRLKRNIPFLLAFISGFFVIVFAPATQNRLKSLNLEGTVLSRYFSIESLNANLASFLSEPLFVFLFLFTFFICLFLIKKNKWNPKKFLKEKTVFWFLVALVILLTIPASPSTAKRLFFPVSACLSLSASSFIFSGGFKFLNEGLVACGIVLFFRMIFSSYQFSSAATTNFNKLYELGKNKSLNEVRIDRLPFEQNRLVNLMDHSYLCTDERCHRYFQVKLIERKTIESGEYTKFVR